MQMNLIREVLEILAYLATVLGVPIAVLLFYTEKRKERRDREYGTYNALDDKYIEFLKLCLLNPDIDTFDIPMAVTAEKASPEQKRKELVLFSILISILERAFLMYKDQSTKVKKTQWSGWKDYMIDWSRRPNFQAAWDKIGKQFEGTFVQHMESFILSAKSSQSEASQIRQ